VVCGHIHQPEIRSIQNDEGSIVYLNSGDWIENLSALEYVNNEWKIFHFDMKAYELEKSAEEEVELSNNELFENLMDEFNSMKTMK